MRRTRRLCALQNRAVLKQRRTSRRHVRYVSPTLVASSQWLYACRQQPMVVGRRGVEALFHRQRPAERAHGVSASAVQA